VIDTEPVTFLLIISSKSPGFAAPSAILRRAFMAHSRIAEGADNLAEHHGDNNQQAEKRRLDTPAESIIATA